MRRPGAMTKEQLVAHLHKQADDLDASVPLKETAEAYIGAIGVPLVDWVLAEMPYDQENDALRITLETMRGMMIGVAEVY